MSEALLQDTTRLAKALVCAVNEHGRPNTFSPRELHEFHGAPPPMTIGRIVSQFPRILSAALAHEGWEGTSPQYLKVARRFYV